MSGTRYFTGKPCKRGHIAERKLSNRECVTCAKNGLAAQRLRLVDSVRARDRAWREANVERCAASQKRHYDANVSRRLAATAAWREANQSKIKAWRTANPDAARQYQATRRALKLASGGTHTKAEIKDLLGKQAGKCPCCLVVLGKKYHVDHVMPLKLGGSNGVENLQILCAPCNRRKHAKHPDVWASERGMLL